MKLLKIFGVAFGVIVTLAIVAAIALWLTFDPNDYKSYLADWVGERTGRELVIEDDLELTFFPWLGVTTGNIRLGNAPGFGGEPFASIDRTTVSVRLLPLLRRQVEIGTVRLDGFELNLATDADGRNNWSDFVAEDGAPESQASGEPGEPFLESLNIAGIDINDGLIFWHANTSEVRYVLSELALETGAVAPGEPVDGELSFRLVSVEPQLSADLTVNGTLVPGEIGTGLETRNVRVAFNLADGSGNERATGSMTVDGVRVGPAEEPIAIARGNLTARLVEPPVGPDQTEVQIDWAGATLERQGGTLRVEDLATSAAGITARWEVTGSDLFGMPELRGAMRINAQPLTAVVDALAVELPSDVRESLGELSAEATFVVRPTTREATLSSLRASALGIDLSGELVAAGDGSANGRFTTSEFDPSRALSLLPEDTLARIDRDAIGPVRISGGVTYTASSGQIGLSELDVAALGTHLTGTVERSEAGQRYSGTLTVPALEATRLAAVLGDLMPASPAPSALGSLALSTRFDYAAADGTLALEELAARAAGLEVQGGLRFASLADSPTWSGRIEVLPFDPETLLARLERPAPERADPETFQRARASAELDGSAARIVARNLRVMLDESTITGELTVGLAEPATYGFDLAIDRLDADRYMPPATAPPPEGAAPVAADVALPTEPLKNLRLDGAVRVGDLRLAGLSLQNVAASLDVADGLGVVDTARAELYGGSYTGRVELDARGETPLLALNGTATTIQLEPLLADLRGEANMTGSGSFELSLAGTGAQLSTVLDDSAGRVSFSVRDGQLRGFNLGRALCSAYNTSQSLPRPAAAEETTRFTLVRGSAEVTDGIARTQDLEATMAFMAVQGRGQSDLVSRELNYDLVATLTGSIAITNCDSMDRLIGDSIPVRVTGTILAPSIQPDYRELVRGRIRDELQDRLRERLENRAR
jgi:AsmA protein